MLFKDLTQLLNKIEKISSRLEMTDLIVAFLEKRAVKEGQIFSYFLEGRLAPLFVSAEFGFSEKSVIKVLEEFVRGHELEYEVKEKRDELGDIGLVAEECLKRIDKSDKELELIEVYEQMWQIALEKGSGSMSRKENIIINLLNSVSPIESKFITRIIVGDLRIGVNVKTVLDALSILRNGDKSLRDDLDKAYGFTSDIGYLIYCIKEGLDITEIGPVPGVPFFPRLVQRVGTLQEGVDRMLEDKDRFLVQPKFDGMRCQIHKGVDYSGKVFENRVWNEFYLRDQKSVGTLFEDTSDVIKLFSRNLEDLTEMFPDIVQEVRELSCSSCILDSEIVAVDKLNPKNGEVQFVEFQKVMTRRRKYGINEQKDEVPVIAKVFDILELDGDNVASYNIHKRMSCIKDLLGGKQTYLDITETPEITNYKKFQKVFENYVDCGLEGVIIKKEGTEYIPGVRDYDWIKLKKSIQSKVVDTLDLVVLGYYYGSGKQKKFGMGALLIGTYNDRTDKFIPLTKLGTGITEDQWNTISKKLHDLRSYNNQPEFVKDGDYDKPDVWIAPEVVVEVEADEISKSSVYPAGKNVLDSGLSLRFPRLKIFDRDKLPKDVTSEQELVNMWQISVS